MLKSLSIIILATTLLVSCKKEDSALPLPQPAMEYTELGDKEIKQNAPNFFVDLNKDGRKDIFFGTLLVGDDINKLDKMQFLIGSNIDTKLPVNVYEQIPVLNKSDIIPLDNFNGNNWYEASVVVLTQKVTGINVPVFWEGNWKVAVKKYVPVQVTKDNQRFNGWVELTVDISNEKIILHRSAISKAGERDIKAG